MGKTIIKEWKSKRKEKKGRRRRVEEVIAQLAKSKLLLQFYYSPLMDKSPLAHAAAFRTNEDEKENR